MNNFVLKAEKIGKTFDDREWIFKNIDLELGESQSVAITGRNGSGKSTLLKTLSGIIAPTKGKIELKVNDKLINKDDFNNYFGFVSPYLTLYEEFSAKEHVDLYLNLKGLKKEETKAKELLELFNLEKAGNKYIAKFSSGMKQRVKYILGLITQPEILFLDEPFTNLDEIGIRIVEDVIAKHLSSGGSLVIASNDEREILSCKNVIELK
jgi:heme exporter protein A